MSRLHLSGIVKSAHYATNCMKFLIFFKSYCRFFSLAFFAAALLAVDQSFATDKQDQQREHVRIGAVIPLTGPVADRGKDITRFIKIIEPELNVKSKKYRYQFVVDDGKCGAGNSATTITKKFIHVDKLRFIISGCSGETLQVGPLAQRNRVLNIAVLSNHKDVKHLGDYVFRTFLDIEGGLEILVDRIHKNGHKRVAILTEENAFTFGMKKILEELLGEEVIYSDDFPEDTADFRTLLTKIRSLDVDSVYYNTLSHRSLAHLVKQTRDLKMPHQIYSYFMPEIREFRSLAGRAADGMEFLGNPIINNASPEFQSRLAQYIKLYPEGPSSDLLIRTFHDAVQSIYDGIESVGPDPEKVKDYLTKYNSLGGLGVIKYDKYGDIADINYALKRIYNSEIEVIGNS